MPESSPDTAQRAHTSRTGKGYGPARRVAARFADIDPDRAWDDREEQINLPMDLKLTEEPVDYMPESVTEVIERTSAV